MGINTSDSVMKTAEEPKKKGKPAKAVLPEPQAEVKPSAIDQKARWPKDNFQALQEAFGRITADDYNEKGVLNAHWESSHLRLLELPYPMRLSWDKNVIVRNIMCNEAVYSSLATILDGIWNLYGKNLARVQEARMDLYGGCYNFRPRRGLNTLSLHAWGAAIDLDPENNGQGKKWESGKGMIPKEVIEIFCNEGWKFGGTFSNPDPMHMEATS